jgi:hypothetical protein
MGLFFEEGNNEGVLKNITFFASLYIIISIVLSIVFFGLMQGDFAKAIASIIIGMFLSVPFTGFTFIVEMLFYGLLGAIMQFKEKMSSSLVNALLTLAGPIVVLLMFTLGFQFMLDIFVGMAFSNGDKMMLLSGVAYVLTVSAISIQKIIIANKKN